MAAKRFHSEYYSHTGDLYTVEIWDTEFSGSSTFFELAGSGFELKYNGGVDRIAPIMATECTIEMYAQNSTHDAIITDIVSSSEGRFLIWIKQGGANFWRGEVLPDIGNYEEMSYPYIIKIRATDGIAALKDIDYNNAGVAYTGKQSMLMHLINALTKTKWHTDLLTSGTFISSVIDWWESTHTHTSSSSCALAQTYIDHSAYYKFEKGVQEYMSCYEVISDILTVMGARITMREGLFWIEQISYRNTTTVIRRNYAKAGTLASTANYSVLTTINQTQAAALQATGAYSFMPGLKEHRHTFKSRLRNNLLAGTYNFTQDNTDLVTIYKPIENNGGAAKLRLTGDINLNIKRDSLPVSALSPFAIVFKIYLKLDTKALKRGYTVDTNYQINYTALTWDTDPQYFYVAVPITDSGWLSNSSVFAYSVLQSVDITTPTLPESCENFDFEFEMWALPIFAGSSYDPADYTINYTFSNMYLEVYSEGSPVIVEDEREYTCENDVYANNSVISKTDSMVGTSLDPNALGALWVKPSTTYQKAYNWGIGTDTPAEYLEKILCRLVVSGQARPLERLGGVVFGNIDALGRVSWKSKYWLFAGGTWNAHDDEMSGEWFEQDYSETFSTSDPKIIKIKEIDPTIPSAPTSGNSQGTTYELVQKPPGTLFYPVALTTTDSALTLGAVTTISISETLTDGDVYDGDTVVILNPITGIWDELAVTATSTNGQTAISVSGTLSGDYPANSPIIKKPKIGTFSLPEAVTGDILYYNGTKWVAFNKGTSLQVLRVNSGGTGLEYATISTGTVTSVGLSLPSIFSVSGSPVTTSGTLTATLASQLANLVFASPNGSSGSPTFRSLVAADIPNLDAAKITTGTLPVSRGGTGLTSLGTALQVLRVNIGATALEYATISAITGTLTGGRIPFASGSSSLTDDAKLTWDNTNKRLIIGTGTNNAAVNILEGSISGTWEAQTTSASVSGNLMTQLINAYNIGGNGNNLLAISTGGANGGDPAVQYIISGVGTWAEGVDNSDGDAFKISYATTPGGGNNWFIVGTDGRLALAGATLSTGVNTNIGGTGGIGFPNGTNAQRPSGTGPIVRYNSAAQGLEVKNPAGTYTSITKESPVGSWTFGTGAGTSPILSGTTLDSRMNLQITTGTSPAANGTVINIVYGHSYNTTPIPVICAANANAAAQNFYVSAFSTSGFSIAINGTLSASTAYHINVIIGN